MLVAGGRTNEVSPQTPLRINIIIIPTSVPPPASAQTPLSDLMERRKAGNYIRLALNKRRGHEAIESISATADGPRSFVSMSVCDSSRLRAALNSSRYDFF